MSIDTLEEQDMMEEENTGWDKVMPLVTDIETRVAKWGCSIAHAYERIKHERKAAEDVKPYIEANERRKQTVGTER